MQPAVYYNPNSEPTNGEQIVAAHWECLRRNPSFRQVARQWVESSDFRKEHGLAKDYHHPAIHFPRCALDWMLNPADRIELLRHQVANLRVFGDLRFNFGPITLNKNFSRHKVRRANAESFLDPVPLPDAPPPITPDQSWESLNSPFKTQFSFAVNPPSQFQNVTEWAGEWSKRVRAFSGLLSREHSPKEADGMASDLFELGVMLHEFSEIYKLVAVPNCTYSQRGMEAVLSEVEDVFRKAGQLVSDRKFNSHKSYFGTSGDWHWFLECESRGLDIGKTSDLYQLADLYSQQLRLISPGKRRRNVKAGGFRGTPVSSRLLKNRRATIRRHIESIQSWIQKAYPFGALSS